MFHVHVLLSAACFARLLIQRMNSLNDENGLTTLLNKYAHYLDLSISFLDFLVNQ